MKVGDLVTVIDADGYRFGHGILLKLDADISPYMSNRYCSVWMFDFTHGPRLPEKTMVYRTDFISPIKTHEDW